MGAAIATERIYEALAPKVQMLVRRFLDARRRGGEALLEAAAVLAEARAQTKHGSWFPFLLAIGIGEDRAKRLLDIHRKAQADPAFAEAVRSDWLTRSVAEMLAQPTTPPAVVKEVLTAKEPPQVRQVRARMNIVKGGRAAEESPPPAPQPATIRPFHNALAVRTAYIADDLRWSEARRMLNQHREALLAELRETDEVLRWLRTQYPNEGGDGD